ncbi:MAG: hypothetical protein WC455_13720 [Dehalococcoidia bacterium]
MSLYGDSPRSTFSWHYRAPSLTDPVWHSHDCGGSVGNVLCCDILTRCLGGVGFRASEEGQSRAAVRDIFGGGGR